MAAINTGNSSLSANTFEGAIAEAIQLYAANLKDDAQTEIRLSVESNASVLVASVMMPVEIQTIATGSISVTAIDETTNSFTWRTDPATLISAETLAGQILYLASRINSGDPLVGQTVDRVQLSISTDTRRAAIEVRFALTPKQVQQADVHLGFGVIPYIANFGDV